MNIEEVREYCLSKPGVTEGFPFNDTALVFKVAGKMFALLDLSEDERGISLKCDPELAIELREQYPEVTGAWHFNKIIMWLFYTLNSVARNSMGFSQIYRMQNPKVNSAVNWSEFIQQEGIGG
jgi:predicted DNA-binding protein (MmcQ/YjbR family)